MPSASESVVGDEFTVVFRASEKDTLLLFSAADTVPDDDDAYAIVNAQMVVLRAIRIPQSERLPYHWRILSDDKALNIDD